MVWVLPCNHQELLQQWCPTIDNAIKVPKKCIINPLQMYTGFHAPTCPWCHFFFLVQNIKVAENFRGNISFVKTQTRLKLLCLSWICWRCERQGWAESILGNSCWFSADDLKFEFWPVEIDSIYLGGTKLAEEESVSKKVCLERKSKYQHEHQKDPGLQSLCISLFVFWFLAVSFAGSALFWPATTEKSTNKTVLLGTVTHSSRLLVIYWCISKITLLSLFTRPSLYLTKGREAICDSVDIFAAAPQFANITNIVTSLSLSSSSSSLSLKSSSSSALSPSTFSSSALSMSASTSFWAHCYGRLHGKIHGTQSVWLAWENSWHG